MPNVTRVPATAWSARRTVPSPPTAPTAEAPGSTGAWQALAAWAPLAAATGSIGRAAADSRSRTAGSVPRCRPRPAVGLTRTATGPPAIGPLVIGSGHVVVGTRDRARGSHRFDRVDRRTGLDRIGVVLQRRHLVVGDVPELLAVPARPAAVVEEGEQHGAEVQGAERAAHRGQGERVRRRYRHRREREQQEHRDPPP